MDSPVSQPGLLANLGTRALWLVIDSVQLPRDILPAMLIQLSAPTPANSRIPDGLLTLVLWPLVAVVMLWLTSINAAST